MEQLKERILRDGVAVGTEILKVDSFLNHQIDVSLLERLGQEFGARFAGERVDKILTVEASGIAVACLAAGCFGYPPVVFAKKTAPNTMTEGFYAAEVRSFTKQTVSVIRIAKNYLRPGEKVLIIDDFLAHGEACMGLAELVRQAEAQVVGIGIVIEKQFQGGGARLRASGYHLESLAVIAAIRDGVITFA
jgi:xanthine phosphoribosyltransferase